MAFEKWIVIVVLIGLSTFESLTFRRAVNQISPHRSVKIERFNQLNYNKCGRNFIFCSSLSTENLEDSGKKNTSNNSPKNKASGGRNRWPSPLYFEIVKKLCVSLYERFRIAVLSAVLSINSSLSTFSSKKIKFSLPFRITQKVIVRATIISILLLLVQRYIVYAKSLVTEISFANFLKLLEVSPERVQNLQVTSSDFLFQLDGKRSAMARIVNVEEPIMRRLIAAGVDFSASPNSMSLLSWLWTACYAFFLWRITSRMLQGPQDEGAGRSRDKINLKPYGALSFDDGESHE